MGSCGKSLREVMSTDISYRLVQAEDSPALSLLIGMSPSVGSIGFTYSYRADVLEVNRALATDLRGLVAMADNQVVGMAFGDVLRVQLGGEVYPAVYISNLRVQANHRRKGVVRGMAEMLFRMAESELGSDYALYSAAPEGNISQRMAQRYGFELTHPIEGGVVPVRRSPPKEVPDLAVRQANPEELDAIADGMNSFYREHNLWSPVTSASLQKFLQVEVAGIQPNQLYVVERQHRLVAGLSLSDQTQLVRMQITNLPAYARWLGARLRILSENGTLRALTVRQVWFLEGELEAARYLWQSLRYTLRERGESLGIAYDPRDRLRAVFQAPFWLPMFKASYSVRCKRPLEKDRATYCVAGP